MSVLLVDTFSLFFRAFYALPDMSTSLGQPTSALYGLSALLLKLLREERPAGVALARDLPGRTFRHEQFSGYKATRPRPPDPLREQLEQLPVLFEALGFPLFAAPGFEADDVLATLARELAPAHALRVVVTGDRDLLQLVSADVEVLFVGQRGKPPIRYDQAGVEARFGFAPQRLPSYVALVGDPSDNLPKLKGVGEATARKLIREHESISALLARVEEVRDARLRRNLVDHADQLRKSEHLARLRSDVPLPQPASVAPLDAAAKERTRVLFEQWEFKSLLPRLAAL